MFSGMTNHSIDAKGRIVLPAKFREQLGETYYLARGFGNKCIQVMSRTVQRNVREDSCTSRKPLHGCSIHL